MNESIEMFCINRHMLIQKKKKKSCANYCFMWIKIANKVLENENANLNMTNMLKKRRRQMRLIGQSQVIMAH